jgi:hypothetical protein
MSNSEISTVYFSCPREMSDSENDGLTDISSSESESDISVVTCHYTFKKGGKIGKRCGTKPRMGDYCGKHKQWAPTVATPTVATPTVAAQIHEVTVQIDELMLLVQKVHLQSQHAPATLSQQRYALSIPIDDTPAVAWTGRAAIAPPPIESTPRVLSPQQQAQHLQGQFIQLMLSSPLF